MHQISRIYFLVIFFLLLLSYLLVSHLALLFQIFSPGFSSLLLVAYTQTIPRLLVSQIGCGWRFMPWSLGVLAIITPLINRLRSFFFVFFQRRNPALLLSGLGMAGGPTVAPANHSRVATKEYSKQKQPAPGFFFINRVAENIL